MTNLIKDIFSGAFLALTAIGALVFGTYVIQMGFAWVLAIMGMTGEALSVVSWLSAITSSFLISVLVGDAIKDNKSKVTDERAQQRMLEQQQEYQKRSREMGESHKERINNTRTNLALGFKHDNLRVVTVPAAGLKEIVYPLASHDMSGSRSYSISAKEPLYVVQRKDTPTAAWETVEEEGLEFTTHDVLIAAKFIETANALESERNIKQALVSNEVNLVDKPLSPYISKTTTPDELSTK